MRVDGDGERSCFQFASDVNLKEKKDETIDGPYVKKTDDDVYKQVSDSQNPCDLGET